MITFYFWVLWAEYSLLQMLECFLVAKTAQEKEHWREVAVFHLIVCQGHPQLAEATRVNEGIGSSSGQWDFMLPFGCVSKPMVPFWGRCTTHFRTYSSGDWDLH